MALLLAPRQLGHGTTRGAEAAVHAARLFLHTLITEHVVVKLDFKNASNSIQRDKMLTTVRDLVPAFPFYTLRVFIPFTPFLG